MEACNSKAGKPDSFSSEVLNVKSDTDIIGTEFKESAHIDSDIKWNDSSYKNAYLINDSIYDDFESIKPFFNSGNRSNRFSINMDTNDIKNIFSLYKIPYSGQNRLVTK